MVKRINFVDRDALVMGNVMAKIRTAGLDTMEFDGWLVNRYGSNEEVRKAVRDAVKDVSDKEATLYVPEHNAVRMIVLPKTNVIKFLDKSFMQVAMELKDTGFPFDMGTVDNWADEVDDSVSNLLEALFYCMVKNFDSYKSERCHSCWKYILGVARKRFEHPLWEEDSYKAFTFETALMYVMAGAEYVKKALITEYENLGSTAYQLAIRIGAHFNEKSLTDPETFYKNEKGWNILFCTQVRKKGYEEFQDITFAFTANDNSDTIEMTAMFDNPNSKGLDKIFAIIVGRLAENGLAEKYRKIKIAPEKAEIPTVVFSIKHKGITDYDCLIDIEEVRKICIESAVLIAE